MIEKFGFFFFLLDGLEKKKKLYFIYFKFQESLNFRKFVK